MKWVGLFALGNVDRCSDGGQVETMQLLIGVGGSWKCVSVSLVDGCVPCIGGVSLPEENIEPALWFKVIVLSTIFVDCSERVISWNVHQVSSSNPYQPSSPLVQPCDLPPPPSPVPLPSSHSFMAPVEGSVDSLLCTSDLQSLFELAQVLYHMSSSTPVPPPAASESTSPFSRTASFLATPTSPVSDSTSRTSQVEYKSWLRLLHCYLLPLVSLHGDDITSVDQAHTYQLQVLDDLDKQLFELADRSHQVKERLLETLDCVLDQISKWVESKQCSPEFISTVANDLKHRESTARRKIQSSVVSLDLSGHLDSSSQSAMEEKLSSEKKEGEQALIESLTLRSYLEGVTSLSDTSEGLCSEGEIAEEQETYLQLHRKLEELREASAGLSRKKVLSLSVREALEQTLCQLRQGQSATSLDISLQGLHSTDVLPEASGYSANNEYLTLKDKVHKLIQTKSSVLSIEHNSFCQTLRTHFSSRPHPDTDTLLHLVQRHFNVIVEHLCTHFNSHSQDLAQKIRLSYEKLFFEIFIAEFLRLYQMKHAEYCHQLALNSLGASLVDPLDLDLGLNDKGWGTLFSSRTFEEAVEIHKDMECSHSNGGMGQGQQSRTHSSGGMERHQLRTHSDGGMGQGHQLRTHSNGGTRQHHWSRAHSDSGMRQSGTQNFDRVLSDLEGLFTASSPLDQLQFLTSAFRKSVSILSTIKLQPLLQHCPLEQVDASLATVSFDELLPVLVLILLQCEPSFLAKLHVHCSFLADYTPPFLSPGWHGYSLTAFTSALHVISKL